MKLWLFFLQCGKEKLWTPHSLFLSYLNVSFMGWRQTCKCCYLPWWTCIIIEQKFYKYEYKIEPKVKPTTNQWDWDINMFSVQWNQCGEFGSTTQSRQNFLGMIEILIHMGPSMIGVPPFEHQGLTLRTLQFTFLFTFPMTDLRFPLFFLMSNEIILFQILYRHLEYLFFSLMKVRIVKFIACSINGPKFSNFSFFETFYIAIRNLVFVTFIHFMYIST